MQNLKLQFSLIGFINVKDLNVLVEVPELDGGGAAAVRPLASSSPAPVRILLSGAELFFFFKLLILSFLFSVGRGFILSWIRGWRIALFW